MPLTLLQRMAALKETANTSPLDKESAAILTPLEVFIRLYNKAGYECYIDYMEGAKQLHKFLSPIEIPDVYPAKFSKAIPVPAVFHGYELDALAAILSGETYGTQHLILRNLIIYYTAKHILEGIAA